MDFAQQLTRLESNRDWQGLVEELEKGLASEKDAKRKAQLHLELGRVLSGKFLQWVKALKHFQDAYKQNPQLVEALEEARGVYWSLGKLNMVQKLLELELKAAGDGLKAAGLLLELGDVLCDGGDYDRAASAYARALAASGGALNEARECLEDAQVDETGWQERISMLLRQSQEASAGVDKARLLVRAARIARRFAPGEVEEMLAKAYGANPANTEVAALYEGLLVEAHRTEDILVAQNRILESLQGSARADAAFAFGSRWAVRHQNVEHAARLLEMAFLAYPSEAAFAFLRDVYGTKEGNWERLASLAETAAQRTVDNAQVFFYAQAGLVLWRHVGNLIRARQAFSSLASLAPEHPLIKAFEMQIGEPIMATVPAAAPTPKRPVVDVSGRAMLMSEEASPSMHEQGEEEVEIPVSASVPPESTSAPKSAGASPTAIASEPIDSPAQAEASTSAAPHSEAPKSAPAVDEAQIAELRAAAAKQEAAKRYNEYVKTLVQLASLVPDPEEKVELYLRAADLYVTKFANQTEAVKAYEQVVELQPDHTATIEFLRQAYEKRRDWEKLLGLQRREAIRLPAGPERTKRFLEMARLATERVKKPEVTIDLWQTVLESDPHNADALTNLASLYERAKDYKAHTDILEKQAEITHDPTQKIQLLAKLGTYYGDRLGDDEGAVRAWRQVLALDPNERRAQEALKKKYLALGRWDDLEVFYAETGKWDEFIRVLESQEAKETNPPAKISLLMKIAQLWADKKQKTDRAAKSYEKVLELDPKHLAAAEALIPIYTQAQNAKGLAGAIEVKLLHEEEPSNRLFLLREVASIYESKVKDSQKAFERYLAAFQIAPGDESCRTDVERLAQTTGRWEDVIGAYRDAIAKADTESDQDTAIALRLRFGHILVDQVGRVDDALREFRAVYEIDDENGEAIEALERLYRQTSRFPDLLQIYEKKKDLAATWEQKRETLYAIARLYENELNDPPQAIVTYRTILEEDPTDAIALRALDDLYRQLGQWEPYVDVLRRRIELEYDEGQLVDLKYRLGKTLEEHRGDAAGSLDNYREILVLQQTHEGARLALEAMLSHNGLGAEAAAILEPIYELRGDWENLIRALEILAHTESEPKKRVDLLRKSARVAATSLGDLERAFEASARALKDDPANAQTRAELESYAADANAWGALDKVFQDIAEGLSDAQLARDYWMRLAHIDERLGKVDEAAEGYARVLSLDPADAEALSAMDALYRRTERWNDLIGVYRRRIELTTDSNEREALFGPMATVYEEKLGQPEQAIAAYREVLSEDEASQMALRALDMLFTRQGLWADLADNLEAQLQLAQTDDAQLGLMLRLAALREGQMGQVDQAIDIYRQVLERAPENSQALSALERLGKDEAHEVIVAEILEPLYRHSGDFAKLIGVYEVQVRRSEETGRKVDLLHQIAQLYEDAAGDLNAAFDTYARALAVDPSHEATQGSLDRLARATGRFADLAHVFEKLAVEQEEPTLSCALYAMSARVYENDLGDIENAVSHYRRVLSIDPSNLDAANSLERLFRQTERYLDLSLILQRKSDILEDSAEKKDALFQAASIEEDVLERREAAIGVYSKVLDIDSEDVRALDALINLYLGLARWEELLPVYQKKVDLVADSEEKKAIYYQVGAVFERELGDVPRAIDTYQRVLELDPDDLSALSRLDVLYQTAQNWPELLNVLQHESELTGDSAEAISYQYRIAELYEKHLQDTSHAVDLYRDILQQQPDHAPTLSALEGIKTNGVDPLPAALVLEPVYESVGDYPRLISVLEVEVRYADDVYKKVDLLHRIARLYEDNLGDLRSAFDTYARATPIDNANEDTLLALERLAGAVDRWPDVAQLYDRELDRLSEEPDRFVDLGLRVAQIYEVQLENVDAAVTRYRRVLGTDVENQNAVRALDRLFSHTERWEELAQILAREAEIGQSPEEILEFRYRFGQLQQLRLGNVTAAIASYRDILAAAPEHGPSLNALEGLFAQGIEQVTIAEILEPLYQSTGEWEKLARVYEAQLAHIQELEERLAMYYRLADLFEEKLLDPASSMEVYIRAFKEQPLDQKSGEEIERLAAHVDGGWEKLANAYADVTGESTDVAVKSLVGRRLARVFEEELGDVANAEETYRYVLSVDPLDAEALSNLDRLFVALEKWGDLAAVLEQRVLVPQQHATDLVDLYARLGETYEERLGQTNEAIRAYRKIFDELDRTHEGAIAALGRLFEHKGEYRELLSVYERELENAVGDVQEAEIQAKIAHLLSDKLGEIPRAVDTWKRVLDLRGEDPEALLALADLYEREGLWAELTDVLERQEAVASEDEARVAALTRRAQTFSSKLGRDEEALTDWFRILDIDYANLDALRSIANIRRKQGDANELVSILHQTVERAGAVLDAEELKAIFRELGKTYGHLLEQPLEAAEAWTRLLEVDPSDFEAMDALEAIYRNEGRWNDVVTVKMGRAEALAEPEEKIRELLEVAAIWEHELGDKDGGRVAFEKILTIDPAHDQSFYALEELHTTAERWEPLVLLYLSRIETREDITEKSEFCRRIARVFEEKLDDKGQAFEALLTAFAADFTDKETARYLEKMAQATARWGELIQYANQWLQTQQEPDKRIVLCLRLAKWYGEDLSHPEYAQPYYAQVVQLDPNNVGVLRQMASLYRKNSQWQLLGQTLTRALDVAIQDTDRKEILTELGDVLFHQMKEVEQAQSFYTRALDVDPHYVPAIEALERIYQDRGEFSELIRVLHQKVPALTDPAEIAETKLRMGHLYETSLRDLEQAGEMYREALEVDASNLPAMRGLERVYEILQRWTELTTTLEMQLDVVTTERERIEVLFKIANVQEEHFLKSDIQAQRLEQIVEIDQNHEPALEGLERAYRRMRQWLDLISSYERHITATSDRTKKIDLYGKIAVVYADEVEDIDHAIDAYRNIVDLDDSYIPALEALSKLYEKQGDTALAIEMMMRVADLTGDGKQRVEMYYRIGRALDEKLGDRVQAQDRYEMALDLDPAHLPTLAASRQIALDSADWDRAARYLDQEQLHTQAPRARAKLLVELGKLRDEMLGEHELAIQAYELALQSDGDNEDAALPLVEEYANRERWVEAEPLADLLVRKSARREREEQHRLQKLLARVTAAQNKDEKALRAYQVALQLDPTDQETIRGLAEINFRLHDWPGALTNFQKVLTALGEDETEARADVYYKLGCVKREQGQPKQAINNFEKAISLVPSHRPTLDALISLYTELKDWKQVIEYKRQILDNLVSGDERYQVLLQIADIWSDNEKNDARAIEALEEARDIRPDDHKLLHKLLPLYQSIGNWGQMIDTIQAIAEMETNAERKSRYLYTLAQLYRDKENDLDKALELFGQALDLNPSLLEAFERINKILTAQKNWKNLERAFRKMLFRIKDQGNTELEYNLLHNLGIIYRDRLQDPVQAIEAFKLAVAKKPDEPQENQILAELYETTGQLELAAEQQQEILLKDPMRVDPYRALYKLYQNQQAFDEAWCMSAALSFLRKADAEEARFYEDYRPQGMLPVKSRLDNEQWVRNLFHEDANLFIGKIFEMLSGAALSAKLDDLKRQNKLPVLDARFRQDPATSTVTFAKTFGWAAQVLGITNIPQLYVRSDVAGGLATVPGQPPAVIAGQSVLTGFAPQELTFICGKQLALFRGEFFIRTLFPTQTELEILLYAGIKIAKSDFALPPDKQAQVMPVAQVIASKMQPMQIEGLKQAVRGFFDQGAKVNLKRWIQGVEVTAVRSGLLLCGDLEIGKKIISAEPQLPGDMPPAEKMKQLLIFSVSKKYFALRKALGIAVG